MADLKISALTGATTPLAGTEVLPIVQSATTKKVSVADLTAGRAVAASSFTASGDFQTTGDQFVFSSSGGGVSAGHLLKGSTGEVQTWCGGAVAVTTTGSATTLNNSNLVIGTSGKGIDFSATPGTGTSELLADYEEGTWTPAQGSGLAVVGTFSSSGTYTKIGRQVTAIGNLSATTSLSAATGVQISSLPFVGATAVPLGVLSDTGSQFLQCFGIGTTNILYSGQAIVATPSVYFEITYFV